MNLSKKVFYFLLIVCSSVLISCEDSNEKQNSSDEVELLAMVMTDGQYGYINPKDEFVIKPQYPLARTFSDGVACINIGGKRNESLVQGALGGKYHFINTKNEIQFDNFSSTSPMSFYNQVAVIIEDDGSKSLLNNKGKKVAQGYTVLGDGENGLIPAVINDDKKIGFINKEGNWAIELAYKYFIGPYSENLSAFTDTDTKLSGFFDTKGEIVLPAIYTSTSNFSEGLARVKKEATFFFINKKGDKAIETEFENAADFHEGLCAVQKIGEWSFIDKSGTAVMPFKSLDGVREMSEGLIAFKEKNGLVGYMDKTGNVVIEPQFDNGLSFKNGYAIIEKDGKIGFIDKKGNIIIDPKYERAGNFVNPNESNKIIKVN